MAASLAPASRTSDEGMADDMADKTGKNF
jgi:hypothetical protein